MASDSCEESGTDSEAEGDITGRHNRTCDKDGDDKLSDHTESTLKGTGSVTDSQEDGSGRRTTVDINTISEDLGERTMGIKTQSRLSLSGSYYKDRFSQEVWRGVELFIREEQEQEVMKGNGAPLTPHSYRRRWNKSGEREDSITVLASNKVVDGENREGRDAENYDGTDLEDTDYYNEETDVAETDFNETDVCESDSDEDDDDDEGDGDDEDNNDGTDIGGETDFNETDIGETDYNETDIGETDCNETDIGESYCNETEDKETDCNENTRDSCEGQQGDTTKESVTDDQQAPHGQTTTRDEVDGKEKSRDETKTKLRSKMNRQGRQTRPCHGELELERPEREKKREKTRIPPSPSTRKSRTREKRNAGAGATRRSSQVGSQELTKKTTTVRKHSQGSKETSPVVLERKLSTSTRWKALSLELHRTPLEHPQRSQSLTAGDEKTICMTRELSQMRSQMVILRKTIYEKNEEIKELKTRLKIEKTTARTRELQQEKQVRSGGVRLRHS